MWGPLVDDAVPGTFIAGYDWPHCNVGFNVRSFPLFSTSFWSMAKKYRFDDNGLDCTLCDNLTPLFIFLHRPVFSNSKNFHISFNKTSENLHFQSAEREVANLKFLRLTWNWKRSARWKTSNSCRLACLHWEKIQIYCANRLTISRAGFPPLR